MTMLKSFTALIILTVSISTAVCQETDEDGYSRGEVQKKVEKFGTMRNSGFVLLGIGVVSVVAGIAFASNAHWETQSTYTGTQTTTSDASGGAGIICIAIGVPCTIAGIVLSAIGSGKYREYKTRLQLYGGYDPGKKSYSTNFVLNF
jgi:hypothetical protein